MAGKRHLGWRIALGVAGGLVLFVAALLLLLPTILTSIDYKEVVIDLSEQMQDTPPGLFPDKTVRVKYALRRGRSKRRYIVEADGTLLGWPFTARADVRLRLRFLGVKADGSADVRLNGSALRLHAGFAADAAWSWLGPVIEWQAKAEVPPTELTEADPYLASLLSRLKMDGVERLGFGGRLELKAEAEQTRAVPVPKWKATGRVSGCDASLAASGKAVAVRNFRTPFGAEGTADAVAIAPMFMRADGIEAAGVALTNVFASVRATEAAFLVTEAGAGCCGGDLRLYACFLDPKKLDAGVTLFIDGVDAGEVLGHVNGFKGEATGRLNGKLPLSLRNGNEVSFGAAYLQSVPGETGNLRVYDPEPVVRNLAMGGVTEAARDNLAKALANFDYSVLRLGLTPEGEGQMALTVKLEGEATHGGVTVPVSFEVTFHGDIEQLVNTGLRAATRKQ